MTTALDIIKTSLKAAGALGIGQDPLAEDVNDAFYQLNTMISGWRASKRYLVYQLVDLSCVSTGAVQYTVGPGGAIDVAVRPTKLEAAFVRQINVPQPNSPDYPLQVIESKEDYSLITVKQQTSFPAFIFLETAWPLGVLHPWPVPLSAIYELHIIVRQLLPTFKTLGEVINLPDGYEDAIQFNLAVRLAAIYKMPLDPRVDTLAKAGLNTLRVGNVQISRLQMPKPLVRPGIYNPYSDQIR